MGEFDKNLPLNHQIYKTRAWQPIHLPLSAKRLYSSRRKACVAFLHPYLSYAPIKLHHSSSSTDWVGPRNLSCFFVREWLKQCWDPLLPEPEAVAAVRAGLTDPHLQKEPVPWKRKQSDPQIIVYISESPLDWYKATKWDSLLKKEQVLFAWSGSYSKTQFVPWVFGSLRKRGVLPHWDMWDFKKSPRIKYAQ